MPCAASQRAGLGRVPVTTLRPGRRSKSVGPSCSALAWRITTMVLTRSNPASPRVGRMPGPLMIIGGAEDKLRKRRILKEFVAAAGGLDARIAVIPTASSLGPEIVDVYDALFRAEGAAEVDGGPPADAARTPPTPTWSSGSREATGIFMTGGNQLKLSAIICGTPVGDAIVDAHQRGVVVAGTSAGASIQSSHMVAFGMGGATPRAADDPGRGRARPAPVDGDRPALRPAQPLRPTADDRLPVAVAARAGHRRGHRGRRGDRRRRPRGAPRARAEVPSRSWTRLRSSRTPTRPSAPHRSWPAASCCTCCPRAHGST